MTEKSLVSKLSRIMGEIRPIPTRGFIKHLQAHYPLDQDVVAEIRPRLAAANIFLSSSLTGYEVQPESGLMTATFQFVFHDGDSGETLEATWADQAQDAGDFGLAMAATSAQRNFLLKTFLAPLANTSQPPRPAAPAARPASATSNQQSAAERALPIETIKTELGPDVERKVIETLDALHRELLELTGSEEEFLKILAGRALSALPIETIKTEIGPAVRRRVEEIKAEVAAAAEVELPAEIKLPEPPAPNASIDDWKNWALAVMSSLNLSGSQQARAVRAATNNTCSSLNQMRSAPRIRDLGMKLIEDWQKAALAG